MCTVAPEREPRLHWTQHSCQDRGPLLLLAALAPAYGSCRAGLHPAELRLAYARAAAHSGHGGKEVLLRTPPPGVCGMAAW